MEVNDSVDKADPDLENAPKDTEDARLEGSVLGLSELAVERVSDLGILLDSSDGEWLICSVLKT